MRFNLHSIEPANTDRKQALGRSMGSRQPVAWGGGGSYEWLGCDPSCAAASIFSAVTGNFQRIDPAESTDEGPAAASSCVRVGGDDGGRASLDRMRAMVRRFSTSQPASMDTETLPEYTLEEVAEHTAPSDLW